MMNNELATVKKSLRLIKAYALLMTALFIVICFSGFTQSGPKQNFEEITAKRINIVDSTGKTRVILAGEFPKPRANLAGLIFNNEDGYEAGGLVYSGKRDKDGKIDEGSILTFDQYRSDQIVALGYEHTGDHKQQGLTINDRPDTMSDQVKEFLRVLQLAKSPAEAESIRKDYMSRIPGRDIVARRLFAGRDVEGASLVTLSDQDGKPRLRLKVDKLGQASITFLDPSGRVVRTITP
jgi:hypothetical protein